MTQHTGHARPSLARAGAAWRSWAGIALACAIVCSVAPAPADAQTSSQTSSQTRVHAPRFVLTAEAAQTSDLQRPVKRRVTLEGALRTDFSRAVRLDVAGRLELGDDETGFGDASGFSDIGRPLVDTRSARAEITEAVLSLRAGDTRISLGKQTVAWGVLDGARVADAFNPARLREGVAVDNRPQRIGVWGARLRRPLGPLRIDVAGAIDPTVNQFASPGDAFAPRAPRLRGGLPAGAPTPPLVRDSRDKLVRDAVLGVRVGARLAGVDTHVSVVTGPDHDATLRPRLDPKTGTAEVLLAHERRTLIGMDAVKTMGPVVARVETAFAPEQALNTSPAPGVIGEIERGRWLAGAGVDWNAPGNVFLNAQVIVDRVMDAPDKLVRPATDVIATVRAQKRFHNDRTEARAELLGSLSDGDGLARLDLIRTLSDTVSVRIGADLFYGDRGGLFGQYQDQSRLRLALVSRF